MMSVADWGFVSGFLGTAGMAFFSFGVVSENRWLSVIGILMLASSGLAFMEAKP